MYLVGICDDGVNICSFIENVCCEWAKREHVRVEVVVWYTGEDLKKYLEEGNVIDLLFLDIELFQITGIALAEYIRNELENRNMQIVYISGKAGYAQKLFKTQPMDFLVKPLKKKQIEDVLWLAKKILAKGEGRFEFQTGKEMYYLPYKEIIYFVSEGRRIQIITTNGGKEFYGKIKDISRRLPEEFLLIHQSYIVNSTFIQRYAYETVELTDGTVLTISKPYRKQIRQRLLEESHYE